MKNVLVVMIISFTMGFMFLLTYHSAEKVKVSEEQIILEVFDISHAEVLKTSITCKGRVDNNWSGCLEEDLPHLKNVAEKILSDFKINQFPVQREEKTSDYRTEYRVFAQTEDHEYLRITAWSEKKDDNLNQGYFMLELIQDNIFGNLDGNLQKVGKILSKHISEIKVNCTVVGTYKGQLEEGRLEDIKNKVFASRKIEDTEYVKKDNSIIVSAYSPLYKANKSSANIELTITYNSHEDRTYVMLKMPSW